jgi:hypothetical protein
MAVENLLYHYTSVDVLMSILDKGELWASHIRYLNDTSEQRLFRMQIGTRIKVGLQTAVGDERARLLKLQSAAESPTADDAYVICFSRDGGDRLSQWRGYSGNGGVSVGFRKRSLQRRCRAFTTEATTKTEYAPNGHSWLNPIAYVTLG